MEEVKDYISDLPDAILHQILSSIPTKYVVSLSSVSKRWREISADHLLYATTLDFGEEFAKKQTPDQLSDTLNSILNLNRSEKIQKLKLIFSPRNDEHRNNATDWISFATSRGVQELDLDFCRQIQIHFLTRAHVIGKKEAFVLPEFLFDCRTLLTVKLSRCILDLPEKYAGFRSIQTVCLKEVHLTDHMLECFLHTCTLLQVLVLKECGALTAIRIGSDTRLQRVTVYECYNASIIEISGPKIKSLLISAGHLDACKLEDMFVLEEVFIGTRGDEFGGVFSIFIDVFPDLSHPNLIKDFQVEFSNLQELNLLNSPLFGLFNSDVYCFFRHCNCPSLQKISIELSTVSEEENFIWEFRKPKVMPKERDFNSLRSITLRNFRGTTSDIELATYFLQRAPSLELMQLIAPQSLSAKRTTIKEEVSYITLKEKEAKVWQKAVCEKLRYYPKASDVADIRVCESDEGDSLLSFFKWHHVIDVYHR
ncbi:hypothetical protein RDABS01_037526 [Bienertia sinuspersici]